MHALPFCRRLWSPWLVLLLAGPAVAGPPSDTLLPRATKGYVSVARPDEFEEHWRKTQFGQMLDDELMQPFVEDLREQLQDEYRAFEVKLGLTWEDLEDVPAGEMSLSIIERRGEHAALAITMDVTDHDEQADALLAAVEKRFAARGGRKQTAESDGTTLHVFTVPGDAGSPPQVTVYFIKEDVLCGIDDRAEAEAMLKRFSGKPTDNLKSVEAYVAVMDRCRRESKGLEPEVHWFVEPFGFIFAARTLDESTNRRNELDYAKMFQEQGFEGIKGVGGFVNQLVDGHIELLQRTAIYAPPVNPNDPLRWTKSMRMLQTPNVPDFEPQSWVPRMSASYTTLNLRLIDAFDNVGPLFDALQEHDDAWANTLEGWESDPYGPQVNVRKEFIENLGNRITIVTGYTTPISAESERAIFAIEATNEQALSETLAKWMSREPDVVRREVGQFIIWERIPKNHAVEEPEVEVPGFTPLEPESEEETKEDERAGERVLPNSAVTVALGHLMMASDINYLQEILEGFGQRERLASSPDYQQVHDTLNRLAPGERCGWHFGRMDEETRPTFELIRQGKMPEAKTMFGKFLNNLLTTEKEREEGELRVQRIDGSTLPSFEAVRRYFGPHGRVTRSEQDGWIMTGAVLNKEAP
ncbi:MAG: hypothetical protein WD738_16670 [Pirellulales bacterium]